MNPLVALLAVFTLFPQDTAPAPTLEAAIARMQAKDPAGAAKILEALLAREPKNGRAWRNLANARRVQGDFAHAAEALQHSLEVEPGFYMPLYTLGVLRAQAGETDEAFRCLERARDSHKIDMTQIDFDPLLSKLKDDPRFAALHPKPADFADPFVEPVKILHEWDGEAPNDQFGWIARPVGDVDGDGVPDIVTSAPTHGEAGSNAGRIYVYSTKSGKLLWSADGESGDQLGTGVEGAGDTDHDGIPDVIASSPGGGKAFLYSGRDGKVLHVFHAEHPTDDFGRHAAGAGDVDGDGCADVIVGAPANAAKGQGAGRAYVYSGKDGHLLHALEGAGAGESFGSTVAGRSTPGHTLLVVGAGSAGAQHTGRVYVFDSLEGPPKFTIEADETGGALGGMFVSVPGDVDGDGVLDVYASDWQNSALGPLTGRVYVHSGKDGHRLLTLTGEGPGEGFGTSPSVAGDVDGDGHADLIVGAWQWSGAALGAGKAYLHSGADGKLLASYTCKTPGDTFGFDALSLGDTDSDGTDDFLVTSGWSGVHGFHSGRVFLFSSGIAKRAR
ncbi:MAG: FG-GAP repeat protein [Planctomycetes bacterium]|nr:FG-GAP repeat protein [Planctomycetota bacterium]